MKAENLNGNKIQAVIEYINGTRSKIGRTTQKKKDLFLQIMTRSVKRNQKVQLESRKTALWLRGFVKLGS